MNNSKIFNEPLADLAGYFNIFVKLFCLHLQAKYGILILYDIIAVIFFSE